ncbi:hypothetical protein SLEP1_g19481 [Rubroshorea leprosula]|uniref:Uncharacterized protein n=1 Tax=Rubroshorea leprosula TaxID=152421 RepID=A0AAV5J2Y3_9ROSI|nr:hypothetical protein SLEP1_g19481 [Rubroshorea leprosula]
MPLMTRSPWKVLKPLLNKYSGPDLISQLACSLIFELPVALPPFLPLHCTVSCI